MLSSDVINANRSLVGDLADETRLPRNLLERFHEMWTARQQPFFGNVGEDGLLPVDGLRELVRNLKVSQPLLCDSVTRVIAAGESAITFATFVRGYASLHARTLKEALRFCFQVFDIDGDGVVGQDEFTKVINANLEMQGLDASAMNRVLRTPQGEEAAASGVTYDAFRYFASLTSETILACCGVCLHVRDFYVPLTPLGTEAEEAAEEAAKADALRREREGAHAPPKKGGGKGGGEGGGGEGGADPDNIFSDPDFLAALEALKTTPEERAARCKAKGNDAMVQTGVGKGGLEKAVEAYTEGVDERCKDATLNATLLANRAAAQLSLKNWGKALADAQAALAMGDALSSSSALKTIRRGASAAWQLRKLDVVEALVAKGEAHLGLQAAAAGPAAAPVDVSDGGAKDAKDGKGAKGGGEKEGSKGGGKVKSRSSQLSEADEIRKLGESVRAAREAEARKKLEVAAEVQRRVEMETAIRKRGLAVGDFADEQLREQCTGAASGARVWYDAEEDELHWPLLLLYPEDAQSDFIQDVGESEALLPHLYEMFGEHGEHAPPWDEQRRYAAPRLAAYAPFAHPEAADGREVVTPLRVDQPLLPQLHAAQPKGYRIPGVPIVHVVVRGSAYEKRFFAGRVV